MNFPQFAYASVTVFVTRNRYPVINNLDATIQVDETSAVGSQIFAVQAIDPDLLPGVSFPLVCQLFHAVLLIC